MNKFLKLSLILFFAAGFLAACDNDDNKINPTPSSDAQEFSATTEGYTLSKTKVSLGNSLQALWSSDDKLAIWAGAESGEYKSTYGGDTITKLSIVSGHQKSPMRCNVGYYPYSSALGCSESDYGYEITGVEIPQIQSYTEGSFDALSAPSVAVTKDTTEKGMHCKNLLGLVRFTLTGESTTLQSITFSGNNGEIIAGSADVTASASADPVVKMHADGATSLTLDCGDGVKLTSKGVAFYIALPPMLFEKGYTITLKTADGQEFSLGDSTSFEVERSKVVALTLPGEPCGILELQDSVAVDGSTTTAIMKFAAVNIDLNSLSATADATAGWISSIDVNNSDSTLVVTIDENKSQDTARSATITLSGNDTNGFEQSATGVLIQNRQPDYILFTSEGTSKLSLTAYNNPSFAPYIEYSVDDGATWQTWDYSEIEYTTLYLRGTGNERFAERGALSFYYFVMEGDPAACSGNIMTLLDYKNPSDTVRASYCFYCLFGECSLLTAAPKLPANNLSYCCYEGMFEGCTSLTTAPELPAMNLAQGCYDSMFWKCTGLTNPPALPATKLENECYSSMFSTCTSLTSAPELPATELAEYCYSSMFAHDSALTKAPELPSTSLVKDCYYQMFLECTSLTTMPALPATTAVEDCYRYMFQGCTSLVNVLDELPATTLAQYCYESMFWGCTALTTTPALPAQRVEKGSYGSMFQGCTSLTAVPDLPATDLGDYCYSWMFDGCTSLRLPMDTLPATTLSKGCYEYMFKDCTSLQHGPVLPATKLTESCYAEMFGGCKMLKKVPDLPATELAEYCYAAMFKGCTYLPLCKLLPATTLPIGAYKEMFSGCTNFSGVVCLATDISATDCTRLWLDGVSSSGKFYKSTGASCWTERTANGIPKDWDVDNYEDYFVSDAEIVIDGYTDGDTLKMSGDEHSMTLYANITNIFVGSTIDVSTSADWLTATYNSDDISLCYTPEVGDSYTGTLVINVAQNAGNTESRTGSITITATGLNGYTGTFTINVTQDGLQEVGELSAFIRVPVGTLPYLEFLMNEGGFDTSNCDFEYNLSYSYATSSDYSTSTCASDPLDIGEVPSGYTVYREKDLTDCTSGWAGVTVTMSATDKNGFRISKEMYFDNPCPEYVK